MSQDENAERREWRRMLKAAHICRGCKGQDAFTLGGRTYCAECAEKDAERKRQARAADGGEANRAAQKAVREQRKQSGLCVHCGRRKSKPGRTSCAICLLKTAQSRRARNIENGMNWPRGGNGYCWTCNRRMAIPGKRLCPECAEKAIDTIQNNENDAYRARHPWR